MTHSDSMKFRVLVGVPVRPDRWLCPAANDLRDAKRFLTETANSNTNQRVGTRLAVLLGAFHATDPTLFPAQEKADEISQRFAIVLTINGHAVDPDDQ